MGDGFVEVPGVFSAVGFNQSDDLCAVILGTVSALCSGCGQGKGRGRTLFYTAHAAPEFASQTDLSIFSVVQGTAASLEGLESPLLLQGTEVDGIVSYPAVPHGVDPAHGHRLDIGSGFGDMSVLCGVVLAYNEVGCPGGEIVLVASSQLDNFVTEMGLVGKVMSERTGHQTRVSGITYTLVGGNAGAADHNTLEGLGRVEVLVVDIRRRGRWRLHFPCSRLVVKVVSKSKLIRIRGAEEEGMSRVEGGRWSSLCLVVAIAHGSTKYFTLARLGLDAGPPSASKSNHLQGVLLPLTSAKISRHPCSHWECTQYVHRNILLPCILYEVEISSTKPVFTSTLANSNNSRTIVKAFQGEPVCVVKHVNCLF